MNACRSCGAPIRWVFGPTGRRMPINPEPVDGGNITLYTDHVGATYAMVHPAGSQPLGDEPRYVTHFASCPRADRWRAS